MEPSHDGSRGRRPRGRATPPRQTDSRRGAAARPPACRINRVRARDDSSDGVAAAIGILRKVSEGAVPVTFRSCAAPGCHCLRWRFAAKFTSSLDWHRVCLTTVYGLDLRRHSAVASMGKRRGEVREDGSLPDLRSVRSRTTRRHTGRRLRGAVRTRRSSWLSSVCAGSNRLGFERRLCRFERGLCPRTDPGGRFRKGGEAPLRDA